MRKNLAVLLAVVLAIALIGCNANSPEATDSASSESPATTDSNAASASETANANETGVLKISCSVNGNPIDTQLTCVWTVLNKAWPQMIYDALIKYESDGVSMVPKLAKSVDASEDGLTYTITMQDNAKWSDGEPVTAEDVVFTYNLWAKCPTGSQSAIANLEGVQDYIDGNTDAISGVTSSENTVTFKLTQPDKTFLTNAIAYILIMPQHALKDVDPTTFDKDTDFWSNPVTSGAYKIDKTSFPDYFALVRNDDYYGPKAAIKNVLVTSFATGGNDSQIASLISGDLDFAYGEAINDPMTAANVTDSNPNMRSAILPSTYTRQLTFNLAGRQDKQDKPDLQIKEVRQAFNLIINKEACASLYQGQAVAISTLVNPDLAAYDTSIPLPSESYSIEKAKEMLQDAGFDFSQTYTIAYYYTDQTTTDLIEVIKQDFAQAGVKVESVMNGDSDFLYDTRNYDMAYFGGNALDPITRYMQYLSATHPSAWGTVLGEGTTTDREIYDTLGSQYLATSDLAESKTIGDQLQEQAYDDAYILPIYALNTIAVYNVTRLVIPTDIFKTDMPQQIDYEWDKWELLE